MYWYEKSSDEKDIFLSTRIRFARNIKDYPFEPALSPALAGELTEKVCSVLSPLGYEKHTDSRPVLFEKRLISREMAEKNAPSEILTKNDTCIMICEEDHLRIQTIKSGFDLQSAYREALEAETALDERLSFAFDERLGYLTHCPTNLGCAMRASLMMFLPCLSEAGRMKHIERELSQLGITVRGSFGEGSGAAGSLYQISNQVMLGVSEEEILENLRKAAESVAKAERDLRSRIIQTNEDSLCDRCLRQLGIASHAHMITSDELYRLYSHIRLGIIAGYIDMELSSADKMLFENLPYHIISREGKELSPIERDKARAQGVHNYTRI